MARTQRGMKTLQGAQPSYMPHPPEQKQEDPATPGRVRGQPQLLDDKAAKSSFNCSSLSLLWIDFWTFFFIVSFQNLACKNENGGKQGAGYLQWLGPKQILGRSQWFWAPKIQIDFHGLPLSPPRPHSLSSRVTYSCGSILFSVQTNTFVFLDTYLRPRTL